MKRILIDLTDLEQWEGIHGGIQRVVYGIAHHFYLSQDSLPQEVVFISFSAVNKKFHYTSFEPIFNRVNNHQSATSNQPKVKVGLKYKIAPYIPKGLRQNQLARRAANVRPKVSSDAGPEWVKFSQNDIVLVMGKPWDNLDIQKTLSQEKHQIGFKLVQIVYDLIISLLPHLQNPVLYESYTQHMIEASRDSDLMLPISNSTDRDLKKFCVNHNVKPPDTKVIRLGDDITETEKKLPSQKPHPDIRPDFIACIGTIEIRKNHMLLYYTYKLAEQRDVKLPQLVILGGQGWLSGDVQYIIGNDPALKPKIIMLHDVNDEGLAWIYEHCLFTVYPSMYEGWGLPIAESLAYGKLCLASRASSMPEIAGDLIDYFSPYSPEECLDKISLYSHPKVREDKEEAIKYNYKLTTWEQTYQQILQYLK